MSVAASYAFLFAAIVAEVIATMALASSDGLIKLVPSIISIVCFVAAFWLLAYPLRTMPTGIVYAIWSGLGIVSSRSSPGFWRSNCSIPRR